MDSRHDKPELTGLSDDGKPLYSSIDELYGCNHGYPIGIHRGISTRLSFLYRAGAGSEVTCWLSESITLSCRLSPAVAGEESGWVLWIGGCEVSFEIPENA